MPQSLACNYVHITFATKFREHLINDSIKNELFDYIGGVCKHLGCNPIRVGGYKDHIHILCLLSKNIALSILMEEIKRSSSKWIKTKGIRYEYFYWQGGYGAFSVNPAQVDIVSDYIKNQEAHHGKVSFQDEYRAYLKKYKIEYDERYVWD
jgi:putative transposase